MKEKLQELTNRMVKLRLKARNLKSENSYFKNENKSLKLKVNLLLILIGLGLIVWLVE